MQTSMFHYCYALFSEVITEEDLSLNNWLCDEMIKRPGSLPKQK